MKLSTKLLLTFWLVILQVVILFAHDFPAAPKQTKPIALVGGTIHTITGDIIENGTILFIDGKITALGKSVSIPDGAERISISGKHVYPGMVASASTMGLREFEQVRQTDDRAEMGDNNADVRSEVAYFADSELIPVGRSGGVTHTVTLPWGGLLAGQAALMRMDGWNADDITFKSRLGMVIKWPNMQISTASWVTMSEEDQLKQIAARVAQLDEYIDIAKRYHVAKTSSNSTQHPYDSKWDAMIPVLKKDVPILVYANDVLQIVAAINFAKRHDLRMILLGGQESYKVVHLLKEANIPVIITSVFSLPNQNDADYDITYKLPAILHEHGILFSIANMETGAGAPDGNIRNLSYEAGYAVAYGLPKEIAYQSISINPAKIFGVDKQLGSLEVGKDASLIITSGDPMEFTSTVDMMFIEGRKIDLRNRHTQMRDKYLERYKK